MIPDTAPPPRKALAVWSLVLGVLSLLTGGCLGLGAVAAIVLGIMAIARAGKMPAEYGGKGMAIAGIVTGSIGLLVLPFVILGAIAVPSLMRARVSANQSSAVGDIRSVIASQTAYASANGGYYDTLECLASASTCIPGYTGPTPFIDAALVNEVKSGYRRRFHRGAPASGDGISPSSITSFAYTAVPVEVGRTGTRGFCGDASGRICFTNDASEPPVVDGACAEPCNVLY